MAGNSNTAVGWAESISGLSQTLQVVTGEEETGSTKDQGEEGWGVTRSKRFEISGAILNVGIVQLRTPMYSESPLISVSCLETFFSRARGHPVRRLHKEAAGIVDQGKQKYPPVELEQLAAAKTRYGLYIGFYRDALMGWMGAYNLVLLVFPCVGESPAGSRYSRLFPGSLGSFVKENRTRWHISNSFQIISLTSSSSTGLGRE